MTSAFAENRLPTLPAARHWPVTRTNLLTSLRLLSDGPVLVCDDAVSGRNETGFDAFTVVVTDWNGLQDRHTKVPNSSPTQIIVIAAPARPDCRSILAAVKHAVSNASRCPPEQLAQTPAPSARGGLASGALRRVKEFIETNLAQKIELADLADIADLSLCHFSRAFKQSVGMPPHRFVTTRRVQAAIRLIETTNQPFTSISLDVGFSDQSHFTRVFRDLVGETPSAFRRRFR